MNWTPIQWTWAVGPDGQLIPNSGSTWNPLVGCRRVSPGCGKPGGPSCYAERLLATRLVRLPVYAGISRMTKNGPQFTGEHRLVADRLDEPLRTRKGRKVFVNDLGDLFYEGHTNEEIAAVFGVMAAASQHTFQILTKRAKRMAEWFAWVDGGKASDGKPDHYNSGRAAMCMGATIGVAGHLQALYRPDLMSAVTSPRWPLPNVWIGVTTEDRQRFAERVPALREIPAAVRFLSVEPQLEDLELKPADLDGIGWVIQGGWSGPRAEAFDLAWARSLREQCRAAAVPFFLKQLGADARITEKPSEPAALMLPDGRWRLMLRDSHGGDEAEWPDEFKGLRAFPVA